MTDSESTLHRIVREALEQQRDATLGETRTPDTEHLCQRIRDCIRAELDMSRGEILRGSGSEHFKHGQELGYEETKKAVITPHVRHVTVT